MVVCNSDQWWRSWAGNDVFSYSFWAQNHPPKLQMVFSFIGSSTCCRLQNGHGPSDGVAWWIKWPSESFGQSSNSRPGLRCSYRGADFFGFFKNQIQVAVLERLVNMIFPYQTLGFVFCRTATGAQTPQPCLDKRLLLKQIVFCLNRSRSLF